ncbi:hypothetical protein LTS02_016007 [Friedmanniomyces endolithicus]|nr:hypothetical protein LTR94_012457 [Friedmanniomyces endolithicus]KAK0784214.1 hypothetical protein LTR59_011479 [Friedmanniomyces endolithicus]KAK0790615.1 hypothetical protein LTR75_011981 [Friedmanniomyces endolithicus]KAK0810874.1 hypothetical protein LTR38_003895 [Friedmanniomyces endolithicus]KAK0824632.1 hypothetical protein LTR03_017697 [Friedmanniomyces endolithicus]
MSQAPPQNSTVSPPSIHDTEMMRSSVSTSCASSDVTMSDAEEDPAPLFGYESPPKTASTSISATSNPDLRQYSPTPSRPRRSLAERSARATLSRLPGLERHLDSLDDPAERARFLYDRSYDDVYEYCAWIYAHPEDIDGVAALRQPGERGYGGEENRRKRKMRGMGRKEIKVLERGQRKLFRDWNRWGKDRRVGVRDGPVEEEEEEEVGPRGEVEPEGEAEVFGDMRGESRAGRMWTRLGMAKSGEAVRDSVVDSEV